MHGLVFAALQDYTRSRLAPEEAERVWAGRVYDPSEAFADDEFTEQLERVAAATGESAAETEYAFGVFAARTTFRALFPAYYEESADTIDFLLGIEEKIHDVVRATIPRAVPPHLHVRPLEGIGAIVSYTSQRGLCRLLEGLVAGTAAELGDTVEIAQIQCMHRGDPGCVFTVERSAA